VFLNIAFLRKIPTIRRKGNPVGSAKLRLPFLSAYAMPRKHGNSRQGGKGRAKPSTREFQSAVSMGMAGTSATDHFIRQDLSLRPPSGVFRASIPRNLSNQIVWQRASYQQVVTTSTTVITEQNFAPSASAFLPAYSTWLSLYDQYFLAAYVVTIANNSPEGGTAACPQVYTAIDFDSSANLGSLTALSGYGSCNITTLAPGNSVTRFVKPCNATYVGSTAASGVSRTWVDSATSSTLFYGFRSIINNTTAATVQLDYTVTMYWAFRNTI
jgi:hypothetical protein